MKWQKSVVQEWVVVVTQLVYTQIGIALHVAEDFELQAIYREFNLG